MKTTTILALALSLGLGPRVAAAQQQVQRPSYEREIPAALLAQVKVGEDSARALALAKVPGTIEAVELLNDHGKIVWVWDVKIAGKRGITEVSVNAVDGTVDSHAE